MWSLLIRNSSTRGATRNWARSSAASRACAAHVLSSPRGSARIRRRSCAADVPHRCRSCTHGGSVCALPNLAEFGPIVVITWPHLAKFGPMLTSVGQTRRVFGQFLTDAGQFGPAHVEVPAKLASCWPTAARCWATLAEFRSNVVRLEPAVAEIGQHQSNSWLTCTTCGQIWSVGGRLREGSPARGTLVGPAARWHHRGWCAAQPRIAGSPATSTGRLDARANRGYVALRRRGLVATARTLVTRGALQSVPVVFPRVCGFACVWDIDQHI